jgi:putative transposase
MVTALRDHAGRTGAVLVSRRKTCRHYNDPGHAHALTFSCYRRQPFLSKDGSRRWLVEAIDRARVRHRFHLWAYVIMPEHAHLLLWPTEPAYDISEILRSVKQSVANRALTYVRRVAPDFLKQMEDRQPNDVKHYRFWQRGGGYDRNVVEPEAVVRQIDYFHLNPVSTRALREAGALVLVECRGLCRCESRAIEDRPGIAAATGRNRK